MTKDLGRADSNMGHAGGKVGSNPPDQVDRDTEGGELPHKAGVPHGVVGALDV